MHTKNSSKLTAFSIVEILIVVTIVGLLAAIAIPNFVLARKTSQRNICVANLKMIEGAKNAFAAEQKMVQSAELVKLTLNPIPTDLFGTGKYIKEVPKCPTGGTYKIGALGECPTCSHVSKEDFDHHALMP